ncbi:hypothetical protein QE152_g9141 [Popillia japonica]|uniref:Uncharacterized protein n=1 Tax=Popillia japonica TaxID=7064 RepID=A0AAW1LVX2_POPJA
MFNRILAVRQIVRNIHKTPIRFAGDDPDFPVPKRIRKLKRTQRKFQVEDCVPIYLKAGFRDKLLYNGTLVLLLISTGMSIDTLYQLMTK